MEIVRIKKTIYKITHVAIDFLEFNEDYVRIRERYKYQGFQCFKCSHKFEIGEMVSLIFTSKGNKTVCKKCGEEIEKQLGEETA